MKYIQEEEIIQGLNPQQQAGVQTTEGPILIVAGAGSGKTKVLVTKVAYLISVKDVAPGRILAVTFTNKAAKEMKDRLENLMEFDPRGMWIGTFHAICGRILRQESERCPFDKNYTIYDDADQQQVIKKILKELGLSDKEYHPRAVSAAISKAKNKLQTPEAAAKNAASDWDEITARIYRKYQTYLRQSNALDFDDLLVETVYLLQKNPDLLETYQERFQYILVDEYQDTNYCQYQFIKMLAAKRKNICVVGDPDQSIYRWRGADVRNIMDFEKDYPQATVINLEQNYRSTQNILDAANGVIQNNHGRKEKKLWSSNGEGDIITYYQATSDREEAAFVLQEIVNLKSKKSMHYQDFAILYRTHSQSRLFEDLCIKYNLPYRIYGGMKFYERKEIKDIMAYLRLLSNPADNISLRRIINEPKRGIGETTWQKLEQYAGEQGECIFTVFTHLEDIAGISAGTTRKLLDFYTMIVELLALAEQIPLSDLVPMVWERTGYWHMLLEDKSAEGESRQENLQEFLSVVVEFERNTQENSLEDFLAQMSLATDMDTEDKRDDYITLMTLHAAKGLEFPVVFITGMEEKVFPHSRALVDDDELEEERRLCYVGMTRAKKKLYLSRSDRRLQWGNDNYNLPSRFLDEIPVHLLEVQGNGGQPRKETWEEQTARVHNYGGIWGKPSNTGTNSFAPKQAANTFGGNTDDKTAASLGKGVALINIGDKVQHSKFGIGVVVGSSGSGDTTELKVAFPDQGIKQLLLKYAPIKKL